MRTVCATVRLIAAGSLIPHDADRVVLEKIAEELDAEAGSIEPAELKKGTKNA